MVITRQPPAVISIHAPRAGGDDRGGAGKRLYERFQSTPPVRGATFLTRHTSQEQKFQSTPPVRGATGDHPRRRSRRHRISIHAPRAGGDGWSCTVDAEIYISIHAPRAGGDLTARAPTSLIPYFNPRPPCGGRHAGAKGEQGPTGISIHAPRAGGDKVAQAIGGVDYLFQSTPPVRGATNDPDHAPNLWVFQSTPPVRGATSVMLEDSANTDDFNPRPPCGGRLKPGYAQVNLEHFNPRPPCGGRPRKHRTPPAAPAFQSTPPVRGATGDA